MSAANVQLTLTIPRPLVACFATPADLKVHLLACGVWPDRVQDERWRLDTVTAGFVVDLTCDVPLPQGGTP
jgi:hypothetical protein